MNDIPTLFEQIIANTETVQWDEALPSPDVPVLSEFNAKRIPPISIRDYVCRLRRYLRCDECIYLVAGVFLERIRKHRPGLRFTQLNVHRYPGPCSHSF